MALRRLLSRLTLGALLAPGVLFPATKARAWTEAQVQSAKAEVTLSRDAGAAVTLDLRVRVRGGWLESLEVAGLDPDLTLSEDRPPVMLGEDGTRFNPEVHVRSGGGVELRFQRRKAPRRGTYQVTLAYDTHLAHRGTTLLDDGAIRVRWTLPGWRAGLDGVRITVDAPSGSRAHVREEEREAFEQEREERGDRTFLHFRRPHLPRTIPWTVEVDVPAAQMDPSLAIPLEREIASELETKAHAEGGPTERAMDAPENPVPPPGPNEGVWLLGLLVALLGSAKVLTWDAACRRARGHARPVVPLGPPLLRALSVAALASAGMLAWRIEPALGLSLLGLSTVPVLERTPHVQALARPGGFRRATREDRRRALRRVLAARLLGRAWLDLTTPGGLLVLTAALGTILSRSSPDDTALHYGMVVPLLITLTGTRHKLPRMAEERLLALVKLARSLEARLDAERPLAFELLLHEDQRGRWQDARLGIVGGTPPPGLLRLHVAFAARRSLGGFDEDPQLLAVTRAHTPGDRLLSSRWPEATRLSGPGERIACTQALDRASLLRAQDLASARAGAPQ